MTELFENVQALGLLVQATGAVLISALCALLNRVERRASLTAWIRGWLSLGAALVALLVKQALPPTTSVTLSLYVFGEYFFAYWLLEGCAQFASRGWLIQRPQRTIPAIAVVAAVLPRLCGYDFPRIFLAQSAMLALTFAGGAFILQGPTTRLPSSPGLLAMKGSLSLLAVLFFGYLPVFGANIFFGIPLPMTLLKLSSAIHLVLEFMVGFGGAVLVLEQSHTGLLGDNRMLSADLAQMRGQAERDALTNAFNRRSLLQRLSGILAAAARASRGAALLYIDLDNFKVLNDSRGHAVGDQVLVEVARRLQDAAAPDDLVVRMGGDEFILVSTHLHQIADIQQFAERIRSSLAQPLTFDGALVRMQVSIGIAIYPEHGTDADLLLRHADAALYHAKETGRNAYCFFDADVSETSNRRALLISDLPEAVANGELFVEYQPLIDLPSGCVVALEALVRWRHPIHGVLSPAKFIPLAEQSGIIDTIGEAVLQTACNQLRAWQSDFIPLVPIAINVSPRQFDTGRIFESFTRVIGASRIDPALIMIEITETSLMQNVREKARTLQRLRDFGVKISMDDFGTGYSSLSYLKDLPIDGLKIDGSFIRDMMQDPRSDAVVRAVMGIAKSLGIAVVAEGVESPDQANHLRVLGCDAAQGFLFYRPLDEISCRHILEQLPSQRAQWSAPETTETESTASRAHN